MQHLRDRIADGGPPLLLDGATGTELERAGLDTRLPLWSTRALLEAPEAVYAIHGAYLDAGAEIVTANSFRTQARTLMRAGMREANADRRLTRLAVELARRAVARSAMAGRVEPAAPRWVAGSLAPLEDCYRPDLVPGDAELEYEHGRQVELLGEAGVDLVLIETMNTRREAEAAARACARAGLDFVACFVATGEARLLSGESLAEAAASSRGLGALAVGVNCLPVGATADCRAALARLGAPILLSPNLGEPEPRTGFSRDTEQGPDALANAFADWLAPPLAIAGGCCGTTPAQIASLARRLRPSARPIPTP